MMAQNWSLPFTQRTTPIRNVRSNRLITIDLDLPDGRRINKRAFFNPAEFQASKQDCDVTIAQNRFTGNLHDYSIKATIDELMVDVRLHATTEVWRPGQACCFLAHKRRRTFAGCLRFPLER